MRDLRSPGTPLKRTALDAARTGRAGLETEAGDPRGEGRAPNGTGRTARARRWLAPGIGVKRWLTLFMAFTLIGAAGFVHFTWTGPLRPVATRWIQNLNHLLSPAHLPLHVVGMVVAALSLIGALWTIMMLNRRMLSSTGTAPSRAVELLYEQRTLTRGPRVVAFGGGTGLSRLLTGLRDTTYNTTAIVAISDDGGSSGRLRRSLDMIAPGDLTDCYAALSDSPVMAKLMLHRFERGDGIEGHTFGNLMLATLSEEEGGLSEAMQDIHEVLRIRGRVYPATGEPATLVARLSDGRDIHGESQFAGQIGDAHIERVRLEPPDLPALDAALEAIRDADVIVLGPGSLYTSVIPALLVPAIMTALQEVDAPIVYVASLMTEPGETTGMSLEDHVDAITRHLGRTPDHVLLNSTVPLPEVMQRYRDEGAELLTLQGASRALRSRVHMHSLIRPELARHDPARLVQAILSLLPRRSLLPEAAVQDRGSTGSV